MKAVAQKTVCQKPVCPCFFCAQNRSQEEFKGEEPREIEGEKNDITYHINIIKMPIREAEKATAMEQDVWEVLPMGRLGRRAPSPITSKWKKGYHGPRAVEKFIILVEAVRYLVRSQSTLCPARIRLKMSQGWSSLWFAFTKSCRILPGPSTVVRDQVWAYLCEVWRLLVGWTFSGPFPSFSFNLFTHLIQVLVAQAPLSEKGFLQDLQEMFGFHSCSSGKPWWYRFEQCGMVFDFHISEVNMKWSFSGCKQSFLCYVGWWTSSNQQPASIGHNHCKRYAPSIMNHYFRLFVAPWSSK